MDTFANTSIKGYELRQRVGAGSFGIVYQAYQPSVRRDVAIKIVQPEYANQPEFVRRFEVEAQLVARLEHPHIVPLFDYWRDPTGAYLVMRWLPSSLRTSIARGAWSPAAAAHLLDQLAAALTIAHRDNVIHCDIKPDNVLLDEDGNGYLADFSIAKDLGLRNAPDGMLGTPDYLSPEQIRNEPLTPRTDIYSLGYVLYELLTGERAFPDATTPLDYMNKHLTTTLPLLSEHNQQVPAAVDEVLQTATAKAPAQRYGSAQRFASAFRAALPVSAPRAPRQPLADPLTDRELEVLRLMVAGDTNARISEKLYLSSATVKWYIRQIYSKLDAHSRYQAIERAQRLQLAEHADASAPPAASAEVAAPRGKAEIPLPEPVNPYKGLRAFQEADSADFFGRASLVEQFLNRLSEGGDSTRLLAVVGPSGSGKSSVVKAGLIPALRSGALPDAPQPFIADMLPGTHPLEELEAALLRIAINPLPLLLDQLREDRRGLVRAAKRILPPDAKTELFLIIDQFEEVFTLVEDETIRVHFIDNLLSAVSDQRGRVRVILTLRADFYDRPLLYPRLAEFVRSHTEVVLPLSARDMEQAIVGPAERVGVHLEAGLLATIIHDVNEQPGALPLLQYALTELFERRDGLTLTLDGYHATGGVFGALAHRADDIYASLDAREQALARQVFLRLVTLGEGTEDTRRPTLLAQLTGLDTDGGAEDVINAFAQYRLLTLDHDPLMHTPTVEIAHEALLREWVQLREWLVGSRDDVRIQRSLAHSAAEWNRAGDVSFLVSGARLAQLEAWAAETDLALTSEERAFLDASLAERAQQKSVEAERQAREEAHEKRSRNLLRILVAVFALAAVLSGGFGLSALNSRNAAAQARQKAETAEQEALRQASMGLAAQSVSELESDTPERGVLLALEALEQYPYTAQAERALAQTVTATRGYRDHFYFGSTIEALSFSSDGNVAAATSFYDALILDVDSGEETEIGDSYLDPTTRPGYVDIDWSPNGRRLAVVAAAFGSDVAEAGIVKIWDVANDELVTSWIGHEGADIWTVAWSNDSEFIVTGGADNRVRVWNASTFDELGVLSGHTDVVQAVAISPDDRYVASASSDATIRIWDVHSGETMQVLSGHLGAVNAVNWSADGSHIVSASSDGLAIIWDAESGEILQTLVGHQGALRDADWSPDGTLIATASEDGTTRVWEAASGAVISTFAGSSRALAWSPDGTKLAVGFGISGLRTWDMSQRPLRLVGHEFEILDAHWTPDGAHIVTGAFDGTARVWDSATGENTLVYRGHIVEDGPAIAGEIHISADSQWAVTHGGDNNTRVWNIETGEERFVFPIFGGNVFSPDGSKLLIFAWDQAVVIDWEKGNMLLEFDPGFDDFCFFGRMSWSLDGRYVVTPCADLGQIDIWDVEKGTHVRTVSTYDGAVMATGISPDGTRLLTTDDTGIIHIWDMESGDLLFDFKGHTAAVWDAEWSPNGQRIASADETGSVRIWEVDSGQEVNQTTVGFSPLNLNWSPDGRSLIVVGLGSNIPEIIPVWQSTEELVADAYDCCVWRELTREERQQFGLPER